MRKSKSPAGSQTQLVLNYLKAGGILDRTDALVHYRIYNLPEVIHKLRNKGHRILTIPALDPYGAARCVYVYDRSIFC